MNFLSDGVHDVLGPNPYDRWLLKSYWQRRRCNKLQNPARSKRRLPLVPRWQDLGTNLYPFSARITVRYAPAERSEWFSCLGPSAVEPKTMSDAIHQVWTGIEWRNEAINSSSQLRLLRIMPSLDLSANLDTRKGSTMVTPVKLSRHQAGSNGRTLHVRREEALELRTEQERT